MSDQPASCPLCGAILRQSRNLRRHLELLHFGSSKTGKGGVRVRHRRTERDNDVRGTAQVPTNDRGANLSAAKIDHPHMRAAESSDMQIVTPLSMASTVNVSGVSGMSIPGTLMTPGAVVGSGEQIGHPGGVPVSSCAGTMGPPNNAIYGSDGTASMLGCLLPPLPSLPSLSSPHDVFRHGEMLRAGVAYYDNTRQQSRHIQRPDVT